MTALNFACEVSFRYFILIVFLLYTPFKYAVFTRYPDELSKTDSQKSVRQFLV